MTVLRTIDLTKKFGDFAALDGVNIEVGEGEVYGFIGPNGSGKSTTLRVLLGILKASEGRAEIFGKDSWEDAVEIHKRVAYIPGDINLWPNLTGGEVIDLFVKLRGGNKLDRRQELIRKFDLDPTKKCRTYSKGNRQKVALIAAFSSDVDLYVLDEPTSGLDPLMERVFQEYVMEAKKQGKSVLLSSHILSEVEKLCDKVAIIREGKIIETGTLKELRHLTGTILLVETKEPITALEDFKGVSGIYLKGQALSFQVDTAEVDRVMRYVSQFGVIRIESAPPTLEELFMRHYEGTGQAVESGAGGEL
ncbi:antibiotic ABC transporter ATP-binding protein [Planococcus antarcticus DSM 14505]|uniref:ABC transporter ATP-binding protein n=1 Tax=Planococcus antarcticus DSM 14505 TaxID=1185653 RepID=A0A1C7DCG1_9BACL|nr:ABC transporter ATP-binding protein [Planococcus antarcticus]ANU09135.1 ABC transporter ATP-binding protein [Planococcus antarcticus DSM 14505]EIM08523.1 antibiotic ABC transporter ATP-binding protein [Planococcus antarcticus DSM 14505]